MYVTNATTRKSLQMCDFISVKSDGRDMRQLCYDGAFMQIFQPLEPEDFDLIRGKEPTKENAAAFCSNFPTNLSKETCWMQAWPLFLGELKTAAGVVHYCSLLDFVRPQRCFNQIFHMSAHLSNFNPSALREFCLTFTDDWIRTECFVSGASAMVDSGTELIERSAAFCALAADLSSRCYDGIVGFSTYKFNPGTPQFARLCSALPQPWAERCLANGAGSSGDLKRYCKLNE